MFECAKQCDVGHGEATESGGWARQKDLGRGVEEAQRPRKKPKDTEQKGWT